MAGFSYISILNPGFTNTSGSSTLKSNSGGDFGYVMFVNPPSPGGGTVTVTTTGTTGYVAPPRSVAWADMGAWVGTGSPGPGVQYVQWVAGSSGYWLWVRIP